MSDAIERAAKQIAPLAFDDFENSWYDDPAHQEEDKADALHDARIIVKAALTNPDDPDWLARKLAEQDDWDQLFTDDIPEFLSAPIEKIRNEYRSRVQALLEEILGE